MHRLNAGTDLATSGPDHPNLDSFEDDIILTERSKDCIWLLQKVVDIESRRVKNCKSRIRERSEDCQG